MKKIPPTLSTIGDVAIKLQSAITLFVVFSLIKKIAQPISYYQKFNFVYFWNSNFRLFVIILLKKNSSKNVISWPAPNAACLYFEQRSLLFYRNSFSLMLVVLCIPSICIYKQSTAGEILLLFEQKLFTFSEINEQKKYFE